MTEQVEAPASSWEALKTSTDLSGSNYTGSMKDKWMAEHPEVKEPPTLIPCTLNDVYRAFTGSGLYIEDIKQIDVPLAVLMNAKFNDGGLPLWFEIVGASGDIKTTMLKTFEVPDKTFVLYKLTPRTLITGKDDEGKGDLIQYIWGKTVIIFDLAEIMSKNTDDKDAIFAQFRNLYDGRLGGSFGTGANKDVENRPPQMLMGCTPTIRSEFLMNQHLGTRELMYEFNSDADKAADAALKIAEAGTREQIVEDIKKVVTRFIRFRPTPRDFKVSPEIRRKLMALAKRLAIYRVTAKIDWHSGELISKPTIEKHTRIIQQFYQMYKALKSLDDDYPDERALGIIERIVDSSSDTILRDIYKLLENYSMTVDQNPLGLKTSEICGRLRISRKNVVTRLNILWSLGKVDREEQEEGFITTYYWKLAGESEPFVGSNSNRNNEW